MEYIHVDLAWEFDWLFDKAWVYKIRNHILAEIGGGHNWR